MIAVAHSAFSNSFAGIQDISADIKETKRVSAVSNIDSGSNSADKFYILDSNFTANGIIGSFGGYLDGNGKTITLNISEAGNANVGLFTTIESPGVVKNLKLMGTVTITSYSANNNAYFGALAAHNLGTIKNIASEAKVEAHTTYHSAGWGRYAGGIVGENTGSILDCSNTGIVTVEDTSTTSGYAGGISGRIVSGGTITRCWASGAIRTSYRAAGIVGFSNDSPSITNCAALNPSVEAANVNRIMTVFAATPIFSDNYANSIMSGASSGTPSNVNGGGLTLVQFSTEAIWTGTLGWGAFGTGAAETEMPWRWSKTISVGGTSVIVPKLWFE
jgi:hypothetical protein